MNTKKISKIAWYSFLFFCASLLTCLGFHNMGQEKEKEMQIKADKIIAEKFDDEKVIEIKKKYKNTYLEKETVAIENYKSMAYGESLRLGLPKAVAEKSFQDFFKKKSKEAELFAEAEIKKEINKFTYDKLRNEIENLNLLKSILQINISLSILSISLSLSLLFIVLIIKIKRKVVISTPEQRLGIITNLISIILIILYTILKESYDCDWLLFIGIIMFISGILLIFRGISSIINWIKLGKIKKS